MSKMSKISILRMGYFLCYVASYFQDVKKVKVEAPKPEEVASLQYKEPKWSGPAAFPYTLEVLKSGKILEEVR